MKNKSNKDKPNKIKIGGSILPKNFKPSECTPGNDNDVCSVGTEFNKLKSFVEEHDKKEPNKLTKYTSREQIIKRVMEILNVSSESEIYKNPTFRSYIGADQADKVLSQRFNPPGPFNSSALLNNRDIDGKQAQWMKISPVVYGKKYYPIPFQMIDFEETQSELARVNIANIAENYDCMGVVLNTDYSTGRGIHWFCIFCDFSTAGTNKDPYTIEYFNSSGFPPHPNVAEWMRKAQYQLHEKNKYVKIIKAVREQLQYSNTECGVWSLMYLQSRLEGYPCTHFNDNKALDDDMLAFRAALFRHS